MNNHIEIHHLELLLLGDSHLSVEEREKVLLHLEECSFCESNYLKMKSFYQEIESEIKSEPNSEDLDFAKKLLPKKSFFTTKLLEEPKKAVKVYDGWIEITEPYFRTRIQKFVRFISRHPKSFTSSLAFAGIALTLILLNLKNPIKDRNPERAFILNQILYVLNEQNDTLWTKPTLNFDNTSTTLEDFEHSVRYLLIFDIDNDKKNEVLLSGSLRSNKYFPDTIYCFNNEGKLIRKFTSGEFKSVSAERWAHTRTVIERFFIFNDGTKDRLLVTVDDQLNAPGKISEIDFTTSKELRSFYNSGQITFELVHDIDSDGKKELIIGGITNAFKCAFIAVLDPDNFDGFSPSTEFYIPKGMDKGNFKYYITFPVTEVGKFLSSTDYNSIKMILGNKDGGMTVYTTEILGGVETYFREGLLYIFDKDMKIKSIVPSDPFNKNYQRLLEGGKVTAQLDAEYFKKIKNSIKYWDGDKFVNNPVMNKYYQAFIP